MKASELVNDLQALVAQYGDLPCIDAFGSTVPSPILSSRDSDWYPYFVICGVSELQEDEAVIRVDF